MVAKEVKKYPLTVCIALWHNDCVLLAKRHHTKTFSGYWGFPGGKVEPLELPTDGVLRELEEETGLELEKSDIALVDGIVGDASTRICFIYEAKVSDDLVMLIHNADSNKNHDWGWYLPREARKKKLMPGMKKYLKSAINRGINQI